MSSDKIPALDSLLKVGKRLGLRFDLDPETNAVFVLNDQTSENLGRTGFFAIWKLPEFQAFRDAEEKYYAAGGAAADALEKHLAEYPPVKAGPAPDDAKQYVPQYLWWVYSSDYSEEGSTCVAAPDEETATKLGREILHADCDPARPMPTTTVPVTVDDIHRFQDLIERLTERAGLRTENKVS